MLPLCTSVAGGFFGYKYANRIIEETRKRPYPGGSPCPDVIEPSILVQVTFGSVVLGGFIGLFISTGLVIHTLLV